MADKKKETKEEELPYTDLHGGSTGTTKPKAKNK